MKLPEKRPMRIFIADAQHSQLDNLRLYIGAQRDVELVGCATDGGTLLESLKNGVDVDVLIMDMVLRGRSSLMVLQSLSMLHFAHRPRVILTVCNPDPAISARYIAVGVDLVVCKPYLMADLMEQARLLVYDDEIYRDRCAEELAHIHLERMRADTGASGYWYTVYVLRRMVKANGPSNLCKEHCEEVGRELQVSYNAIESGVRRLIETIHNRNSSEYREMREYAGTEPGKQMTNSDFLSRLAQMIRLELWG